MSLQHIFKNSSVSGKEPTASQLANGELSINYHADGPFLCCKDTAGVVRRIAGVWVAATPPGTPTAGELWLDISINPTQLKIYKDGVDGWVFAGNVVNASTTTAGVVELSTDAETQAGGSTVVAVTPASLQSKLSDSTSTSSSTTIASSSAVKAAYDLAATAISTSGGTITGTLEIGTTGSLTFEGSSADAYETTLGVVDPTGDRSILLPDTSGTVITTGDTGTVTSTMIADGTIVNADVNASAAIAGTKISPDFGSQTIQTTGIVSHALGSAAAPTLTFTGDTNTGIYSPGADQLALSTNGTGRLFVDASGNVGVGVGSPSERLEVNGNIYASPNSGGVRNIGVADSSNTTVVLRAGAASGIGANIELLNSGNIYLDGAEHRFRGTDGSSERARIDSSGRLLVGTSSALSVNSLTAGVEVHSTTTNDGASISIVRFNNDTSGPQLILGKSRNATVAAGTVVQNNDDLGSIHFNGDDGTDLNSPAARIQAFVDGTPGANDMPGRLVFSTTADGASSPTERMRISSDGRVGLTSILSGSANVVALNNETTFKSGNSLARGIVSIVNSASNGGTPYTISDMYHFYTFDGTHNADATATNKYGYYAHPSLVESATNTYAFYGEIADSANRWNFYAGGTAPNYFTGAIASLGSYNDTTASAANVFIASNGDIQRSTSSIRYKTDIETLEQSYADNVIFNAHPVWYRSLCEADNAGWSYYGLIAEEVAELDPRLVFWGRPTKEVISKEAKPAVLDDEGNEIEPAQEAIYTNVEDINAELRPEGVQYDRLTVMLIDVVQRQQKTIKALEARVAALEAN